MARRGERIGLLGGSFDPAHEGHVRLTHEALKRFGLDRIWWLVSPQNPLKTSGPAPLADRMAGARAVMRHPRVEVLDIEDRLGTRATVDTLRALQSVYPRVRFTWLMGADNLAEFHLWQDWREIMARVPVGVLARPRERMSALRSPAARAFAPYRLAARDADALGGSEAPCWCFLNMPMLDVSSTAIRARNASAQQ